MKRSGELDLGSAKVKGSLARPTQVDPIAPHSRQAALTSRDPNTSCLVQRLTRSPLLQGNQLKPYTVLHCIQPTEDLVLSSQQGQLSTCCYGSAVSRCPPSLTFPFQCMRFGRPSAPTSTCGTGTAAYHLPKKAYRIPDHTSVSVSLRIDRRRESISGSHIG